MKSRTPLLLFAALGLGASLTSSYVHYNLLVNPSFSSFCDVNATVSCTQAYLSPYGSFLGVPVALAGVFFFAVVLAYHGLERPENAPGRRKRTGLHLRAVDHRPRVRDVSRLRLLLHSSRRLHPLRDHLHLRRRHLHHFGLHNLFPDDDVAETSRLGPPDDGVKPGGVGVGSGVCRRWHDDQGNLPERAGRGTGAGPEFPPLTDQQKADLEKWWDVQPKKDVPVPNDGVKVLMVKFNDYQCPACGQTYRSYAGLIDKWTKTGQFKFVSKHFPLDAKCNGGATPHPAACEAAAAVVMARRKETGRPRNSKTGSSPIRGRRS